MKTVFLISIVCLITCRAQVPVSGSNDVASQASDSATPSKLVVTSATTELSTDSSMTEPSTKAPPAVITSPSSAPANSSKTSAEPSVPTSTKTTPAPTKTTPTPTKTTPTPTKTTPTPTEITPTPTETSPTPTKTTPTTSPTNTTATESTTTTIPVNGQSWSWRSFFSGVILMIVMALFGAGGFYLYLYKRRVSHGLGYHSL